MSLKNNKQENKDQPLRCSTYNILDAYDNNIPQNSSNLIDDYSIHPLQKLSDGYSMDFSPTTATTAPGQGQGELNTMMEDLSLSPNNSDNKRQRSMPYCV
ncbi:hypothetical protein MAM1_0124d05957 [Mucor ambiguus]|uniref:Uncharacterized protein n=1 Tax=Mucor ambiguus TaxID=91626 RepID=A0A0C9MWE2_9FUNG|nr:hypothetical protein MAM1_0124d05957 [Mucor ambiguus]